MNYWYNSASFYHIYTFGLCNAPFYNTYGDVENKLDEIEKWIPHIKEMGCNAIYFGPVFKSKTHGYDTTDYFHIDNRIGNNEEFKSLVEKLHQNDIHVVLDGVFNHCGRDFFAFKDIREKGQASDYCDWFSGLDFNKKSPLGDDFSYSTWSGYYELIKLNLKNPAVKNYLFTAVRYWIEYFKIDGLRLDAADCLDLEFMGELRRFTSALKNDFWLMGEVVHGDYNKWVNENMLHSVTNYEIYKSLYSSHNDKNLFEIAYALNREFNSETGIYKNLMLYNFADNHDQDRLASIVKCPGYLYTIYILLYTIPGIPSLYYGSEWGIKGVKSNNSDEQLRPYIDLDAIAKSETCLSNVIKKLSAIRNNSEALKTGSYKQVFISYEQPFAFERSTKDEKIIIIINAAAHNATVNMQQYNSRFFDVLNDEVIEAHSLRNLVIYSHWGRILRMVN